MNKTDLKKQLALNGWLIFVSTLLVLYILWNKPLLRSIQNLQPIAFAAVFMIAFSGIGIPIIRKLYPRDSKLEEFLFSLAAGMGLSAVMVFSLGAAGIVSPMIYALWTLLGLTLFVISYLKNKPAVSINLDLKSPMAILSLSILIPLLLQAIPPLVSPVVSVDSLEYHLLIPKIFLQTGKITFIPSLVESNYPCMAEYLYMLIIPLGGDIICKSLHFLGGIAAALTISRITTRINPSSNALLGPALFLSMPVTILVMGWAWNDAFFVFFLLLTVYGLIDYDLQEPGNRNTRPLLIAGIAAGLAAWMKYTIVLVLVALVFLFITAIWRRKWKWHHLLWFFVPLGLLSLLVFVKNWAFAGNPFYPFLHKLFPTPHWTDAAATYFFENLRRWEFSEWNWTMYFTFPFHMSLKPWLIDTHPGILPLALSPLLFFRLKNRGLGFLKVLILCFLAAWLLIQTEVRSLLLLFALIFCAVPLIIEEKIWQGKGFRRPLVFLLILAVAANLGITIVTNYHLTKPVRYFLGLESRKDFLHREARSQPAYEWLNKRKEVGNVLLVGLYGPYYLEHFPYFSSVVDPPIVEKLSRGMEDPEKLSQWFQKLGITHVVINQNKYVKENKAGLYSWTGPQKKAFEACINQFYRPAARFGGDTIYALPRFVKKIEGRNVGG